MVTAASEQTRPKTATVQKDAQERPIDAPARGVLFVVHSRLSTGSGSSVRAPCHPSAVCQIVAIQATIACALSIASITWRTVNGLRRIAS
jgi:hypothetical protein